MVVGDWDCDGNRTPALLHGRQVWRWDTWGGQPVGVGDAPGATKLVASPGDDGCDEIDAVDHKGVRVPIDRVHRTSTHG
jgi:hypothetical protein